MKNLDSFSMHRFVGELRRVVFARPSIFLLQIAVIFGTILLFSCYIEYVALPTNIRYWNEVESGEIYHYASYNSTLRNILHLKITLYIIFSCIAGSMIFTRLRSKQEKIAYMMEPVIASEKYLAQFVVYVIGFSVVFLISCLLTDILRPMIMGLTHMHIHTEFTTMFPILLREPFYIIRLLLIGTGFGLMSGSFFMVGSVVWPRNSFVKTAGFLIALSVAIVIWVILLSSIFTSEHPLVNEWVIRRHWLFIPLISVIIAIFNWIVVYIRFKETDINK